MLQGKLAVLFFQFEDAGKLDAIGRNDDNIPDLARRDERRLGMLSRGLWGLGIASENAHRRA